MRRASIKETGEELSQREWERFDAAAAQVRQDKRQHPGGVNLSVPADKAAEKQDAEKPAAGPARSDVG